MTNTKRKVLYGLTGFFGIFIVSGVVYFNSLLPIITGYAAKNLCSAVFVSGRQQADVEKTDLYFSFIKYTKNMVNTQEKSVTSRFLWRRSKAIFREGVGVTLLRQTNEKELRAKRILSNLSADFSQDTIKWPLGDVLPDSITVAGNKSLEQISKALITDNSYNGNAFAFIVLHKGVPVAEAYKPGFDKSTRLLSWSMAKSFTNALVGILVSKGMLDINAPANVEEWKNDERSKITINDLLHMQSGLKWNEDYGNRSNVNVMLHCKADMAKYAYEMPLEHPAGTFWYYSSGTTNIVNWLIRKQFANDSLYYSFIHKELFNKIGITDAMPEVDPSGTFVGSSYLYATARDYARFALLFQNDGIFNGERILPEGWVSYSTTPASASNNGYGAFFWLNRAGDLPSVPKDMYSCEGHDGQMIFIIPSRDLIVVVLGYSPKSKGGMDFDRLLKDILGTL